MLSQQDPVEGIRELSGDLFHPCFVGIGCAAGKVNAASGHFDHEEDIVRGQTTFSPDLDGREVDRGQDVPMGSDESLPGCLPFVFRSPFDAMFLEDVSNGLVRDLVA